MKRILLCTMGLLLLALSAPAAPWGAVDGVDDQAGNPQRGKHTSKYDALYVLQKITSGENLNVHVTIQDQKDMRDKAAYLTEMEKAYNAWFQMGISHITHKRQQKNFGRVLTRLRHPVRLREVSSVQQADITLTIVDSWESIHEICDDKDNEIESIACMIDAHEGRVVAVYMPAYRLFEQRYGKRKAHARNVSVWQHEVGHTLGLDDQYDFPDLVRIQKGRRYHSTHIHRGIMRDSDNFSCDDADGLINMVDIAYGTEANRSQGWPSFCDDSRDMYLNGLTFGASPYVITSENFKNTQLQSVHMDTYKDGRLVKRETLSPLGYRNGGIPLQHPFSVLPNKTVKETDGLGRPVRAVGPSDEEIYYDYQYYRMSRLIKRGPRFMRLEIYENEQEVPDHEQKQQRALWTSVSSSGKIIICYIAFIRGVGGEVWYHVGDDDDPLVEIAFDIDKSGNRKQTSVSGDITNPDPIAWWGIIPLKRPVKEEIDDLVKQVEQWGKRRLQDFQNH